MVTLTDSDGDAVADIKPLRDNYACRLAGPFNNNEGCVGFPLYAYADMHTVYQSGWNEIAVRSYLLRSLVTPEHRTEVQALLDTFEATWVRLSMYDLGAEIYGSDLIVIHPGGLTDRALVLEISYFQG